MQSSPDNRDSYHHGDLKQALLTKALEVLEISGLEKLSLRDLAQSLGVSKTAPYRHFKDKEQLLVEVAAEGFGYLADSLEKATSTPSLDSLEALNTLQPVLEAYIVFSQNHPELYKIMFSKIGYGLHSERCKVNANRAMGCLVSSTLAAQALGWKKDSPSLPLTLSLWSLAHGWAGMFTENLIPPEIPFERDNWWESVVTLIR